MVGKLKLGREMSRAAGSNATQPNLPVPLNKAVNLMPLVSYAVRQAHTLEHYGSAVLGRKPRILPSDSLLLVLHPNLALLLTLGVQGTLNQSRG